MEILKLNNVAYRYHTQHQNVDAVKGVTYAFESGRFHSIIGPSGSGKSTLLCLMAGLAAPTGGEVVCEGKSTSDWDLAEYRREKVAVIYQNFRLFPLLTVAENIMYPMELKGINVKTARQKALETIGRVGLPQTVADRFPTMLSGGEQQRVAIARALCKETKILLADEPTGNLDTENGENIFQILQSLAHDDGYCVVMVTHEMEFALRTDDILHLRDGRMVGEDGETQC